MSRRSCRKAQAYAELRWVDLYVHPTKLREIRSLAADLMRVRYPFLGVRDAYRTVYAAFDGLIFAYPFHVHPGDIEYLRAQADATLDLSYHCRFR